MPGRRVLENLPNERIVAAVAAIKEHIQIEGRKSKCRQEQPFEGALSRREYHPHGESVDRRGMQERGALQTMALGKDKRRKRRAGLCMLRKEKAPSSFAAQRDNGCLTGIVSSRLGIGEHSHATQNSASLGGLRLLLCHWPAGPLVAHVFRTVDVAPLRLAYISTILNRECQTTNKFDGDFDHNLQSVVVIAASLHCDLTGQAAGPHDNVLSRAPSCASRWSKLKLRSISKFDSSKVLNAVIRTAWLVHPSPTAILLVM
jgi:hypothetical protein